MNVLHDVRARPIFMKVASVRSALARFEWASRTLVYTGQPYDANMSEVFFRQLQQHATLVISDSGRIQEKRLILGSRV